MNNSTFNEAVDFLNAQIVRNDDADIVDLVREVADRFGLDTEETEHVLENSTYPTPDSVLELVSYALSERRE